MQFLYPKTCHGLHPTEGAPSYLLLVGRGLLGRSTTRFRGTDKAILSRRSGTKAFSANTRFALWSEKKRVEKLRYMHRNPVKRGLVQKPEDWEWSSFRHYLSSEPGIVEIESEWTARRRERMGIRPALRINELPRPTKTG